MIGGILKDGTARIRLRVKGPRREKTIDAIIDTGYSAELTLPQFLIDHLGLQWRCLDRATLADGSRVVFDTYASKVVWDGRPQRITVDQSETEPLIGMALLEGFELTVQVRPGGKVTIRKLM